MSERELFDVMYYFEVAGHQPVREFCACDEDALSKALESCLELSRVAKKLVPIRVTDAGGRTIGEVPVWPRIPIKNGAVERAAESLRGTRQRVEQQRARVIKLRQAGHDATQAECVLQTFEETARVRELEYDLMRRIA